MITVTSIHGASSKFGLNISNSLCAIATGSWDRIARKLQVRKQTPDFVFFRSIMVTIICQFVIFFFV